MLFRFISWSVLHCHLGQCLAKQVEIHHGGFARRVDGCESLGMAGSVQSTLTYRSGRSVFGGAP